VLTFGLPWAVLAVILSYGALWAWALLAATASLRVAVALVVGWSVLRDRQVLSLLLWLPLRDLVALLVWLASLVGHNVVWRGDSFTLKDGKLARIDS
jgi:ceramide glucosyltransferase